METVTTRALAEDDIPELVALLRANREFLAPWDPIRADEYFTDQGQATLLRAAVAGGNTVPHVILVGDRIAGRITLDSIVRGVFQSCSMGYWVAEKHNGKGVATAAVGAVVRHAFEVMKLHRAEAGTLVHNVGSQRVLECNGFTRFGTAPKYLQIAGAWQDHLLFQRINEDF